MTLWDDEARIHDVLLKPSTSEGCSLITVTGELETIGSQKPNTFHLRNPQIHIITNQVH